MASREGTGLVVSVSPKGERDALVAVLCPERGLLRGYVNARGKALATVQPFDTVHYAHFRRLDNQLGTWQLEQVRSRAVLWLQPGLAGALGSALVGYLSDLLGQLLPEEHVYAGLNARVELLLAEPVTWPAVMGFELALLEAVGYGLRLDESVPCAAHSELMFVSPASGRPVPRLVAQGYEARLLVLPTCLGGPPLAPLAHFAAGWQLTGHFLQGALHGKVLASRQRLETLLRHACQAAELEMENLKLAA